MRETLERREGDARDTYGKMTLQKKYLIALASNH